MKVLLGAFGDPGHAFPVIALGAELARRGHDVTLPTWRKWESQVEAEDYYDRYAVREADSEAVDEHMRSKKEFAHSHDERAFREYRQRFAGGAGSYPLVGTPERIVDDISRIAAEGYEGAALSFVNYVDELPFFCARVLPLMRETGLRVT